MAKKKTKKTSKAQPAKRKIVKLEQLRDRLREAEETLAAIRNGDVDSLIVAGPSGDQVFSLKGAEQPYRVFVEKMQEGAATVTVDGTILFCNQRLADMLRSAMQRVTGSSIFKYLDDESAAEIRKIIKKPTGKTAKVTLVGARGITLPVRLSFSKLKLDDDLDALCIVFTDRSGEQENQELKAALHNLEVAQAEMHAQQEELIRARAKAEEASNAKDNFLAALSHELRTPLTPVLLSLSSMERDGQIPESSKMELSILKRNVELEVQLIDDLLDLTRIVRGKVELNKKIIDVHAALQGAIEICQSDIIGKQISLSQHLKARVPFVDGDPVRIQQILWNVLRNAVKFTPESGLIKIETSSAGGRVVVSIIDTGIGIEQDAFNRIFNPFEQANRLITRQFGGLGLGLAISKRLAELHGGTITAFSSGRGQGSTFTLDFPCVEKPASSAGDSAIEQPRTGRRLQILLVEDHDDTRRSMVKLLQSEHDVTDASNVAQALEFASKSHFDLVISDLGLPDGSGLELMSKLRDTYNLRGICLTGFGMEEDIVHSNRAGFDYHLTKPISMTRLRSVIENMEVTHQQVAVR